MKTEQHTVTIPISDYNELIEAKDFIGIVEITKDIEFYNDLAEALNIVNAKYSRNYVSANILNKYKFYFKEK